MAGIVVVILMLTSFGLGLVVARRSASRADRRTRSPPAPAESAPRKTAETGEIDSLIMELKQSPPPTPDLRPSTPSNRFVNTEPLWKVPADPPRLNPFEPELCVEHDAYVPQRRARAETPRRFTKGSVPPSTAESLEDTPRTFDDLLTPPDGVEKEEPSVIVDDALLR